MTEAEKTAEKAEILNKVSPALPQTINPEQLITIALTSHASIDVLERLMALQERWLAQAAKEGFFAALVRFQKTVPGIRKTKQALFDGKLQYKYADLSDVINTIKDSVFDCGIAYQWKIEDEPNEKIKVTCLVTSCGHTEATAMSATPDASGKKNPIQARGSAIEYMKRYTLAGALGLSISEDNDGGQLVDETFEEIEIKATATDSQGDLKAYYESLPKKWQSDAKVKAVLKKHEAFLKKQKGGANAQG